MRGPRQLLARPGAPRRMAVRAAAVACWTACVFLVASLTALAQRSHTPSLPFATPAGFPEPRVPSDNPVTADKVEVGRRLFYDTRLSGNQTESCSSCHEQELAFTDGRAQSVGSTGQAHPRSAPSLVNVAYNSTLTWANPALLTLEAQMQVPLFGTSPVELGINDHNKSAVLKRIKRDRWYRRHFPRAFESKGRAISWKNIVRSIASFQRSIVSAKSRYDRYLRGKAELTDAQSRGMDLFMGEEAQCHHCHGTFLFSDQATYEGAPRVPVLFHNNGLYNIDGTGAYPENNEGLAAITGRKRDTGKFKAPSLRNVALTAPYMHDGSIPTLRAVVEHYSRGGRLIEDGPLAGDGRDSPYLDPLIAPLDLSERQKKDLVAFLKSLTDKSVTTNPRFSDPFKHRRHKGSSPDRP